MMPDTITQTPKRGRTSRVGGIAAIVAVCLVVFLAGGYVVNRTLDRIDRLNTRIATLEDDLQQTVEDADAATRREVDATQRAVEATQRAVEAEGSARDATASRAQAEETAELARQRVLEAEQRATTAEKASNEAQAEARQAREQAEEFRRVAEAEMDRLTGALGRIAETRRTALGLVMSLDDGYLKFDFDLAELRPESREVLSQIAGILFTADNFVITVSGHTDARGTAEYNQELSLQRAQTVTDYLIATGLSADLFTVQGLGESQLLDPGNTDEAHATNRRVELGLVSARIVESTQLGRLP
jgi:outer membrane protein OmpA-like peptidoglycan-associated protein